MSLVEIETATSRQSVQAKTASKPGKVTGKLAIACKRIIELGEELDIAAQQAGLTTRTLRLALERPHVIKWMKEQREVFRSYVCAQNIHYAKAMRDGDGNAMARLGAMKLIEQIGDGESSTTTRQMSPGFVVVIAAPVQPAVTQPLPSTIEHDDK